MFICARACYNQSDNSDKQKFRGNAAGSAPRSHFIHREEPMKNPLDSLWGTVISGVVLTAILYVVVKSILT